MPGDEWDYDSTSSLILADLKLDGQDRKVIMHAPKNGFFYVLDRLTGELLSAKNFTPNNWASHVDLKTGRPAIYPEARVTVEPRLIKPANAHNWNPLSYSPLTGLVYIPVQETWMVVSRVPDGQFQFRPGPHHHWRRHRQLPRAAPRVQPEGEHRRPGLHAGLGSDQAGRALPHRDSPYEFQGGLLTTAGNLLVQGTMNSTLAIYKADTGEKLWESPTTSVPVAGPITYSVRGTQYIAVNAGWNNAIVHGLNAGEKPFSTGPAKLVVFKLGAKGVQLPPAPPPESISPPPAAAQPADKVAAGAAVFAQFCSACHGQNANGSGTRDLRFMKPDTHAAFNDIVLGGKYKDKGMVPFTGVLTPEQVDAVHSFVIARGQEDWQPVFVAPPPRR